MMIRLLDDAVIWKKRNITKSDLQEIIRQELSEALPPHLQSKVDAYEKKKQQYSITDVTPPGYGPDDEEEESGGWYSDEHETVADRKYADRRRAEDEEELRLGTPEEDPMKRTRSGRGQASRLRKTVMNK